MLHSKIQQRMARNQESLRLDRQGMPIQTRVEVKRDQEQYLEECLQRQIDLPPKLISEEVP
jgi:hypothetical protein